ncbi:MAG: hypothetical protein DMF82_04780, partial [Acidobacteria bacterium]
MVGFRIGLFTATDRRKAGRGEKRRRARSAGRRACYHPAIDRRRDHVRVETIAVVGAGLMGRGIAYAAVAGGYRTVLHDVSPEALDRARQQVRADLDEGRARGKIPSGDADAAYERLRLEPDLARAVAGAGFVIEAVPEQIELKLRIFARLDEACGDGAVLASNTSSL